MLKNENEKIKKTLINLLCVGDDILVYIYYLDNLIISITGTVVKILDTEIRVRCDKFYSCFYKDEINITEDNDLYVDINSRIKK